MKGGICYSMKKNIIRFFVVLLLSVLVEIVVFQGANIFKQHQYGDTANLLAPVFIGPSVSRIIAMLVVYWGTRGLSLLQKSPDYGITEKE